ncbi:MAG: hypothetical protein J0H74_00155 [Chitinophagaceae bacterium]|nr:hypothetical protein [Chitinophagaceae bacterium]
MIRICGGILICLFMIGCGGEENKKITVSDTTVYTGAETDTVAGVDTAAVIAYYDIPAAPELTAHSIHLQKGVDLSLQVPGGFNICVAYEGLRRLRFLTKSPDGRLFATDMFNTSDNKRGRVYAFEDWDSAAHAYRGIRTFLDGLHNPNQVAFYNDKGQDYIYVSETGKLSRYPYHAGDTVPSGPAEQIAAWPDYGLDYKYGGWHLTRSLAFHEGKLYVSVGSSCNVCIEKEDVRATIQEMNPDGSDRHTFATGLRNSVGIKWVGNKLWATSMGRDLLGPDRPEDLFQTVSRNIHYGWPYYFQFRGHIYDDTAMQRAAKEAGQAIPGTPPLAQCGFLAHSAPLGFDHFSHFSDSLLSDVFLVALHGSTTVSRQRGNSIVAVYASGRYVPIVDGFLTGRTEADRKGRPCDVMMNDARSFFFTDDKNGVLYYVWKD